jgi:hypothetical protein
MAHLYLEYQISIPLGSKDISQDLGFPSNVDLSPKSRSLGQNLGTIRKVFPYCMHYPSIKALKLLVQKI